MMNRPAWLPPTTSSLPHLALLDISVDVDEERSLRRSRWTAAIRLRCEEWTTASSEVQLAAMIDAHLRGRRPITGMFAGHLLITFSVTDGAGARDLVNRFASSLHETASAGGAPATIEVEIFEVDGRDIDHLLPEDRRAVAR